MTACVCGSTKFYDINHGDDCHRCADWFGCGFPCTGSGRECQRCGHRECRVHPDPADCAAHDRWLEACDRQFKAEAAARRVRETELRLRAATEAILFTCPRCGCPPCEGCRVAPVQGKKAALFQRIASGAKKSDTVLVSRGEPREPHAVRVALALESLRGR